MVLIDIDIFQSKVDKYVKVHVELVTEKNNNNINNLFSQKEHLLENYPYIPI
jgi:hypothetical protein